MSDWSSGLWARRSLLGQFGRLGLCSLGSAAGIALPAFAAGAPVQVVTSDTTDAYQEVFDTLQRDLAAGSAPASTLPWLSASQVRQGGGAERAGPRLLVTLGADALRSVLGSNPKAPVLAALVPRSLFERISRDFQMPGRAPVSVLYLDQPPLRQFDLLRLALPQVRRVGVLLGPESVAQQGALTSAAMARQLELVTSTVNQAAELPTALSSLLESIDVLLALPDSLVFNNSTLGGILLSSYRAKVPMLGFSPAYVRAGAALGIYSSPAQIGQTAAQLARQLLGSDPSRVLSAYSSGFTVEVNDRVAGSLRLSLDAAQLTERLRRAEGGRP